MSTISFKTAHHHHHPTLPHSHHYYYSHLHFTSDKTAPASAAIVLFRSHKTPYFLE